MNNFNALILGTDNNSYSVARSFYENYGKKPIVAGSARLVPFIHSKIAEVHTRKDFSNNPDVFVNLLNNIGRKHKGETLVIFVPIETYIEILEKNEDRLDFDFKIPYPGWYMTKDLIVKSEFYKILEKIDLAYPKTQSINSKNIDSLSLSGKLFMKADDYEDFIRYDFDVKQKGYIFNNKEEAKEIIKEIYKKSDYKGQMLVQNFIEGGDGSEYSLNGYRSQDGKVSMCLARNLLSDKRPMWIGNHIVQIDHYDKDMYDMAKKLVDSLGYVGLFNVDFKKDSKTGKVYILEMNVRQGRTFYYTNLSGMNLISLAVDDLVKNESRTEKPSKRFMLTSVSKEVARVNLNEEFLDDFDKRLDLIQNPIINEDDNSFLRNKKVSKSIRKNEEDIFK